MDRQYIGAPNRDVPPARPGEFEAPQIGPLRIWPPVVLALGGGTLHQPGNLDALQACCTVVSLLADLDEIRGRLGAEDEQRPLWADAEARFAAREAGYHRADFCVDVSGLDISDSVDAVLGVLPCG